MFLKIILIYQSLDNVLDSVYVNYYKDWPQKYIIDRGPVMTKGNFALMQKHFKNLLSVQYYLEI